MGLELRGGVPAVSPQEDVQRGAEPQPQGSKVPTLPQINEVEKGPYKAAILLLGPSMSFHVNLVEDN